MKSSAVNCANACDQDCRRTDILDVGESTLGVGEQTHYAFCS